MLLDTGLGICKALTLNFLSALTAFGGLYIGTASLDPPSLLSREGWPMSCAGISLGQNDTIRPWLFALAAGMFIYVALVDMVTLHSLSRSHSLGQSPLLPAEPPEGDGERGGVVRQRGLPECWPPPRIRHHFPPGVVRRGHTLLIESEGRMR